MNSKDIKYLDKYLADAFKFGESEWDKKYPMLPSPIITQTHRSKEYQDMLYAQGRKTLSEVNALRKAQGLNPITQSENKIVTNAIGGKSKHNFNPSRAFDIAFYDKGKNKLDWSERNFKLFYELIVKKFPEVKWGGNFKSIKDFPHFEI